MRKFTAISVFTLFLAVLLGGCSQYQPLNTGEVTRIALAPIINEAEIPQIIAPLSRNLRERLNHSPAFQLVDEDQAEAVLRVTITGIRRETIARDPSDTGRPLSYYDTLTVRLDWESSDLPAPWGSRKNAVLEADTLIYAQPGLIGSESVAVTELAEDFARKIVARLSWPQ